MNMDRMRDIVYLNMPYRCKGNLNHLKESMKYLDDIVQTRKGSNIDTEDKLLSEACKFLSYTLEIYGEPPKSTKHRSKYNVINNLWKHRGIKSDQYVGFSSADSFYSMMSECNSIISAYNSFVEIRCNSLTKMIIDLGIYCEAILFHHDILKGAYGFSAWTEAQGVQNRLSGSWWSERVNAIVLRNSNIKLAQMLLTYDTISDKVFSTKSLYKNIKSSNSIGVLWPKHIESLVDEIAADSSIFDARHFCDKGVLFNNS